MEGSPNVCIAKAKHPIQNVNFILHKGDSEYGRGEWRVGDVVVEEGRIADISDAAPSSSIRSSRWLLPGFIDLMVNAMEWWQQGEKGDKEHMERFSAVKSRMERNGVTGFLLNTLAAPPSRLLNYLR